MKKSFFKRMLAVAMAVCMVLSMAAPASAAYKYTLKLHITEEKPTLKPNSHVENKIAVEDYSSVGESGDLTTELVYLLAANFEGVAEQNKAGLWQFESDAMGLTIEAGLRANRKSDEAWFAWIDTFASEGRITGDSEDKGDLVQLLRQKAKISDMEPNTEYVLYYEPDNTVKLNPDLNMTLADEDPAKGNTYIFTLTLVRSEIGVEDHPITVNNVANGAAATNVDRAKMGDKVIITATADEGYAVKTVKATQGNKNIQVKRNSDGTYFFTMPDGPVTVTVTTAPENYSVNVKNTANSSVTVDLTNAQAGEMVTITADAFKGYEMETIKVTCGTEEISLIDNGNGTYSFVMPNGHVTVGATTKPRDYRVDTVIDRGTAVSNVRHAKMGDMITVATEIPSGYVVASITVTIVAPVVYRLRAVPRAAGLDFTDNGDGNYSFIMPADDVLVSITTMSKKHSVTVNDVNNGSAEADKTHEEKDETVTITPSVDDGFEVDEVKVTTGTGEEIIVPPNEDGDYTFEMPDGDVEVTVTTKPKEYSITVNDVANGSAATDVTTAKAGETVTITPTADDGFLVNKVKVTCGTADIQVTKNNDGTYSFQMPVGDVVVSVTTIAKPSSGSDNGNDVIVNDVPNGNATADVERAEEGETVTITTNTNAGHEIDEVKVTTGTGEEIVVSPDEDGDFTFEMPDSDVEVTVTTKPTEYNITVKDVSNGSAVTNMNSATAGETVTITADADTGYEVNSVKVTCGSTPVFVTPGDDGKYTFTMPVGDVTVNVTTKATLYPITVNDVPNGNATSNMDRAKKGEIVTITATAALGYAVDSVKVTSEIGTVSVADNGDGTYSFIMPAGAVTVDATTRVEAYPVTVNPVDNGIADAVEQARMGETVTITAAADAGYEVTGVEVTSGTTPIAITDNGDGTYSFTMPAGGVTVDVTTATKEYRVHVENVVNGTATTNMTSAEAGNTVTITATAEEGYEVNTVSITCGTMPVPFVDNGDGTYSFDMPVGDVTVNVTTRAKPSSGSGFPIVVETVANGNATADMECAQRGETVTVTAHAYPGYEVKEVQAVCESESVVVTPNGDGTYSFTMPNGKVTVTVVTTAKKYPITVENVTNGSATASMSEAKAGETVTIHASAEEGYEVTTVKVTCGTTPVLVTNNGNGTYSFIMPVGAVTVTAATKAVPSGSDTEKYDITVNRVANGTATTNVARAEAGKTITITTTADTGYVVDTVKVTQGTTVVSVTDNGNGTYSFVMPAGAVTVDVTTKVKPDDDGPVAYSYPITVKPVANGTATADATRALVDKKITVTATADEGYVVDKVKVTWGSGSVLVTDNGDGTYSFTMPAGAVTVTVITKAKVAPPTDPSAPGHGTNCPASRFDDVDLNEWYHKAIDYVVYNGLMAGLDEKNFGPDWELSRAMCAQIFFNLEGQPGGVYDNPFPDVAQGKWYYDAVTWAFAHGVVSGYGDGLYRPEQIVTREELVQIYCNYAKAKGWSEGTRIADLTIFVDYEDVAPWHEVAVSWGVGSKLLGGKGGNVMAPKVPGTRAEAAQMLMNMCENIKK